jgi:hypothetical protein
MISKARFVAFMEIVRGLVIPGPLRPPERLLSLGLRRLAAPGGPC